MIGSLLTGVSFLKKASGSLPVIIIGVLVVFGYIYINGLISENRELQAIRYSQENEIKSLAEDINTSNESIKKITAEFEKREKLTNELTNELNEIKRTANKNTREINSYKGERFKKILKNKPNLISKKMTKSAQETFKEIQNETLK